MGSPRSRSYNKHSSTDRIQEIHVGSDEVSRRGKPANKGRIIMFISTVSKWRLILLGNSKCHCRSQSCIIPGGEIFGCYNSKVCQSLVEGCSCRTLFLWHFLPLAVWAFAGQKASSWMGVSSHRLQNPEGTWVVSYSACHNLVTAVQPELCFQTTALWGTS